MNRSATLASGFFLGNAPQALCDNDQEIRLPHTVLKHTLYASKDQVVIDSISWVYDNTRGRMRYYPFMVIPAQTPQYYDVVFSPRIIADPNGHLYNAGLNANWYEQNGVPFGTPNYFPAPSNADITTVDGIYPSAPGSTVFEPDYPNNIYTHPPQYGLFEAPLLDHVAQAYAGYYINGGLQLPLFDNDGNPANEVPHTYIIDKPIDLRLINPSEKIIYNPSDVEINIDGNLYPNKTLVFPSGYTFRTVHGEHPSEADVLTADPLGVYPNPALSVPSTLGPNSSVYRIKSGSTLEIQPCVTIMDADFIVEAGATLRYDAAYVDGNFAVDDQPGSTVEPLMVAPPTLPCVSQCYQDGWYDIKDRDVSSSETWTLGNIPDDGNSDDILRVAGTVSVKQGAVLTIEDDVRLEFGPHGRIVVERGGRLKADHATFTSACNAMWEGIEVWGTKDGSQFPLTGNADLGTLYFSYCTVENARLGLGTLRSDDPTSDDAYNGGVLQVWYTTFRNNYRSVHVTPTANVYNGSEKNNRCQFYQNDFITEGYLIDEAYNDAEGHRTATPQHILLEGVRRVPVNYNTFTVTPPVGGAHLPHLRGSGIEAQNASFTANNNEFTGLSQGIWQEEGGGAALTGASVRYNEFNNCIHSILCVGTAYTVVRGNLIDVPVSEQYGYPQMDPNEGYDYPVGVYMLESTNATVEGNTINGNETGPTADPPSYAIVLNASAFQLPNEASYCYLNTIGGTSIGLQCEGDNKGDGQDGGLLVECNTFGTPADVRDFDWVVVGNWLDPNNIVDAPMRDQGECDPNELDKQAGNQFSAVDADVLTLDHLWFDDNAIGNNVTFQYSDRPAQLPFLGANNAPVINPCNGFDPRDCQPTGTGGKPALEVKRAYHQNGIVQLEAMLAVETDPAEIEVLRDKLAYERGQLSIVLNLLVQYVLEYEDVDSALQYLSDGEGLAKYRRLAAFYLAAGDTAEAASAINEIIVLEGTPSNHTQFLQLKLALISGQLHLTPQQQAWLEAMVAGNGVGNYSQRAVLRHLLGKPYFRVPWKVNDDIAGYRSAEQKPGVAEQVLLMPNPAHNTLLVKGAGQDEPIVVHTIDGHRVAMPASYMDGTWSFDLSGAVNGVYVLTLPRRSSNGAYRFVVLK